LYFLIPFSPTLFAIAYWREVSISCIYVVVPAICLKEAAFTLDGIASSREEEKDQGCPITTN
jgi:hypothetical protein